MQANVEIPWNSLPFKKTNGKERLLCPACSETRTKKKDKCLSVDHANGTAKCFHCLAYAIRDKAKPKEDYKMPAQDWKNYTALSDGLVKWLETERKIPQYVAIELGWTEEKQYQPSIGKEVNNLVFNFFEREAVVNKKYRTANKAFTQSKDGKPILYNINACIGSHEIYIVEGEMDVAALYTIGIKNVVSVPNGANDNDNYWINSKGFLSGVDHFILGFDNDEKGINLRELVSHRLGKAKCSYVQWAGKDANDDLISGQLESSIKNKKRFPVTGVTTTSDHIEEMMEMQDIGLPPVVSPKDKTFGRLSEIFGSLMGQLTVITGIPGSGKSSFNDWLVLNLMKDYGLKASWYSPEHYPVKYFMAGLAQKVVGKKFWKNPTIPSSQMTKEEQLAFSDWKNEKIYFVQAEQGKTPDWDWLISKMEEQVYSYGVNIFVIDAFNKVLMPRGNELQNIRHTLNRLTVFCQVYNVMVFLVAHPTKMKKKEDGTYEVPTLYDVAGSADFYNMTHNGYTIYRVFADPETGREDKTLFINTKTKFQYQGRVGESIELKYNPINGRFYTDKPDNTSWLSGEEPKEEPQNDLYDEIPF